MENKDIKDTELRLGPPGTADEPDNLARRCKRPSPEMITETFQPSEADTRQESQPSAYKAQVVGWPPIRSNRKSSLQARKSEAGASGAGAGIYVKVSMDGAPYLRKIDLRVYRGYEELRKALEDMFKCFTSGDASWAESVGGSSHAVAYEDKDGDLMLVGDVPWRMFVSSCKKWQKGVFFVAHQKVVGDPV
ncbi:hypothetical protein HPP92_016922 [Vanilla planifolia]|uniref:Auxin-responsive protein n=1 Tax=Vanilla planifolia TaxID=51239 RepID=A0A835UUN2_VANPL|nr:hypothetical protein HPP92_016922 [Vanilla planifolia]